MSDKPQRAMSAQEALAQAYTKHCRDIEIKSGKMHICGFDDIECAAAILDALHGNGYDVRPTYQPGTPYEVVRADRIEALLADPEDEA